MEVFSLESSIILKTTEAINGLLKVQKQAKEAGVELDKTEKTSGGFSKTLGNVGKAVAGFASSTAIVSFAKSAISSAEKGITTNAKLTEVLKSASHATDAQVESLKKYASEMTQNGVIGTGLNKTAMSQLATFGLQADSIKKLIPQLDNLAVNQKGVNNTSEDMMGYANLIGKVMQGNATAMTRVGVTMSEHQKKLIEQGNESQRVATITEVLKQNYGNLNEKIAQTPEGKAKKLENEWGGLKEQIGTMLLPVVESFTNGLQKIFDWWNKLSPQAKNAILIIAGVVASMGFLVSIIGTLNGLLAGLGLAFTVPFAPVIIIVGGVVAAIALLWIKCEGFRNFVKGFASGVVNVFKGIFNFFKNDWKEILLFLVNPFAGAFALLYKHNDNFRNSINKTFNGVKDFIRGVIDKVKGFFNFDWHLPKIKLPHFSIKGEFSLTPPSTPYLGVDWYSSGGIFTKPTVLGGIGVGDADHGKGNQAEAVLPISELRNMIKDLLVINLAMNVDGREFVREVVAPHQNELAKWSFGR
ncbi:hypothetical protein [Inconstantimicrobium mannanitabidum]|uniref:Uncharacterized protein n=1 Tax=Inconstantimicrobium mannanitabidum TaxID=1604901 RepID=A0ACB5R9Y2_9CLOT|nr:hypothetical protein [Clostridium sp. TW13]GKX65839.1 hypothetical protein rsdtw13_10970 [Clostridium sp. TW13]